MKRPRDEKEWLCEVTLWAMEGNHPRTTAAIYGVEPSFVRYCLKKAGTIRWAIPGRGAWKRQNFIMLSEDDRVRLGIDWGRCYLTGCEMIFPNDVNPTTFKWGDPPVAWQRILKGSWG